MSGRSTCWRMSKRVRPQTPTKSGLMLGFGETIDEVLAVMRDLRASNVDILTLGQYLRPLRSICRSSAT